MVTGVASIADEWALLELGFRCLFQRMEPERGRRRAEVLGLIHIGGTPFIDIRGRRRSSGPSRKRRWIGRLPVLHRAAYLLGEEDDGEAKR
jgi:hypothetical protein